MQNNFTQLRESYLTIFALSKNDSELSTKSLKDLGKQTSALQGSPESGREERCGTQGLE